MQGQQVCEFYRSPKGCRFGNSCKNLHDDGQHTARSSGPKYHNGRPDAHPNGPRGGSGQPGGGHQAGGFGGPKHHNPGAGGYGARDNHAGAQHGYSGGGGRGPALAAQPNSNFEKKLFSDEIDKVNKNRKDKTDQLIVTQMIDFNNIGLFFFRGQPFSFAYNIQSNAFVEDQILLNPAINNVIVCAAKHFMDSFGKEVLAIGFESQNHFRVVRKYEPVHKVLRRAQARPRSAELRERRAARSHR